MSGNQITELRDDFEKHGFKTKYEPYNHHYLTVFHPETSHKCLYVDIYNHRFHFFNKNGLDGNYIQIGNLLEVRFNGSLILLDNNVAISPKDW